MAGIYIHIPFCKKMCFYCDFYHIIAPDEKEKRRFADAVSREAQLRNEYLGNEAISTIYFGGGTPSVFKVHDLESIIKKLKSVFNIEEDSEITIEVNPDDISREYLNTLKTTGINRISMGVQSWRDEDLKLLNRRHNAATAARALSDIFDEGFDNVSIDLIYGIPGMNISDWEKNLEISFSYDIKHLSAYHLTFEKGTVFGKMLERGQIKEVDEEESTLLFNTLVKKSEDRGFVHYEISNFGKPGFFSKHNSNYWKQVKYLGLGPSAHSFDGYSRQWNRSDVKTWLRAVESGRVEYEREELDLRTRFNEYIMTSLRTMWGMDLEYIESTFEKEGYDYILNLSGKFMKYGLIKQNGNNLVLTSQGQMISDNIISEFMMPGNE